MHNCSDLGDITVVAVTGQEGEPIQRLLKLQYLANSDAFHVFNSIGNSIGGFEKAQRYAGNADADIVIIMTPDVSVDKANEILDHLLTRVTKFLDRARRQRLALNNSEAGYAISGEVRTNEFFGR